MLATKRVGLGWTLFLLALLAAGVQFAQMRRGVPGPHLLPLAADVAVALYAVVTIVRARSAR